MKTRFLVALLLCLVGLVFAVSAPAVQAQTGAGWFWVEDDLWVKDDAMVQGDQTILGTITAPGAMTLGTVNATTLNVSGVSLLTGNTRITGTTALVGAVTTTGAVAVGSTLVVAGNATVTGTSTLVGAVAATGQVDVGTNLVVQSDLRIDGEALTIAQDDIITPTSSYMEVSAAGAVSTGSIAAGTEGDLLILVNVGAQTITISNTGTLLLSGDIALAGEDSLTLIADGTNWVQLATSNN